METLFTFLGFLWGILGFAAACSIGKPGLWRIAIFMGPFAFLLLKPSE